MDEMNKPVAENAPQMAEGLETSGMSRRERRELAMRLAAEEAARKAAEEASAPAVEEIPAAEETPAVEPLFEEEPAPVEEPTREFTPISLREATSQKAIFDMDDEEDAEEEEEVEEKPRRGLFNRRKHVVEEEPEDDEDGFDDDEDDEYEDDEVEEKPRRGLFGRRKRIEEEEDEDDFEDEYDDDEDDEYDEYDEDDEDDYDDDDDEYDDEYEHHSFGYHLIRGLLWMVGILVVLVIGVFALNFLYSAGHPTIVPQIHDAMGDTRAFNLLFPVYGKVDLYEEEGETVDVIETLPEVTEAPTALPAPEATASIPNLDADANSSIVVAPVIQANPVGEANAAGSIG